MLILLVHDDLRDAEHMPHEFPHRLGADVGVPEPENLVISWKDDTGLFVFSGIQLVQVQRVPPTQ